MTTKGNASELSYMYGWVIHPPVHNCSKPYLSNRCVDFYETMCWAGVQVVDEK